MTWRQLETLVCGSSDIDIELLRRHTVYAQDIDPDSELVFLKLKNW